MLPTFVIGLREGLEAALIVGMIAAFLRRQGQRQLLRWVGAGVGLAVALCVLAGLALRAYSRALPQTQQEGLETIIGAAAVLMITYMVVWTRRNSRGLKGQLEGLASAATSRPGSAGRALVAMAFLAVIREGVETVVFVLAAFNESGSGAAAGWGLLLGLALAVALGYGIYRGGIRINLSRFFRATGVVLVLVAAGIVVNALHTAHEAGWLTVGQRSPVDLSWLVQPGTVQASLLTSMLGLQSHPAVIEIVGWFAYVVPMSLYVGWPVAKAGGVRARAVAVGVLTIAIAATSLAFVLLAPTPRQQRPAADGAPTAQADAQAVAHRAVVTITAAQGCRPDHATFRAGGVTFAVSNKDATAVSEVELLDGERIVGEKENIPPGFGGQFAARLTAGNYTLYCPGASPERSTITVTGRAAATPDDVLAPLLAQATAGYAKYVNTQTAALTAAVGRLDAALHGTNLAAAQTAYLRARPFYEKIEPVAESFHIGKDNVDTDIDIREGDIPASQWRGFHRIEKAIFHTKSLRGMGGYGDKLVADVSRLRSLCAKLKYQPTELANGAQELLDEVASNKITGEEERYSHVDLLDFANNDEGAEQAFAQLQPALNQIDSVLAKTIQTRFAALDETVNKYRTGENPSGFRLYSQLDSSDKRALAAAVKAVQEPLSQVASKVAAR